MKFLTRQNSHDKKQSGTFLDLGGGGKIVSKSVWGNFFFGWYIDVLYLDCGGRAYPEYVFVKFTELYS